MTTGARGGPGRIDLGLADGTAEACTLADQRRPLLQEITGVIANAPPEVLSLGGCNGQRLETSRLRRHADPVPGH